MTPSNSFVNAELSELKSLFQNLAMQVENVVGTINKTVNSQGSTSANWENRGNNLQSAFCFYCHQQGHIQSFCKQF